MKNNQSQQPSTSPKPSMIMQFIDFLSLGKVAQRYTGQTNNYKEPNPQAKDPQAQDPQAQDPQAQDPQAKDPQAQDKSSKSGRLTRIMRSIFGGKNTSQTGKGISR